MNQTYIVIFTSPHIEQIVEFDSLEAARLAFDTDIDATTLCKVLGRK